jgi:hypothetical protein
LQWPSFSSACCATASSRGGDWTDKVDAATRQTVCLAACVCDGFGVSLAGEHVRDVIAMALLIFAP